MTTKKTTAAAAEKAEPKPVPDKPYELQPGPTPTAPIMSANLGVRHDPPRVTPPNRGPATGRGMTDLEYLQVHATPAELAAAKQAVEQRRAQTATWAWEKCDHCGLVMKVKPDSPEGDCCVKCNRMRTTTGGHFKRMDAAAVDQHLYDEALREKAAIERDRRAQFNRTNARRGEQGLEPLSYEAFTKLQRDEFQQLKARARDLGEVANLCRRQP
jgi:hypothetical protein